MTRRREFAELIPVLLEESDGALRLQEMYDAVTDRWPHLTDELPDPHAPSRPKWQHDFRWEVLSAVNAGRIRKRDDIGRGVYSAATSSRLLQESAVHLAEVERVSPQPTLVVTQEAAVLADRLEGQMVHRFVAWAAERGRVLKRLEIRTAEGERLVADLFEPATNRLIEAKHCSSRHDIRMAIGQLLDYRTHVPDRPELAMLLPTPPAPSMARVLANLRIDVVVETAAGEFSEDW